MVRLTGKAPAHVEPNYVRSANPVVYDDAEGKGMRFEAAVRAIAEGGTMRPLRPRELRIEGARAVTLLVSGVTGYPRLRSRARPARCRDRFRIAAPPRRCARKKSYAALRAAHIADHRRLFRRVSLKLAQDRCRRTCRPMSGCACLRTQPDPRSGGALFSIRPVSTDCEFAARLAAGEPARHLERSRCGRRGVPTGRRISTCR